MPEQSQKSGQLTTSCLELTFTIIHWDLTALNPALCVSAKLEQTFNSYRRPPSGAKITTSSANRKWLIIIRFNQQPIFIDCKYTGSSSM